MSEKYYYLKKGEIIKDGDEVEISNGFHSAPKWVKTNCIGQSAPDPQFESHRKYRRLLTNELILEAEKVRDAQLNDNLFISGLKNIKYKVPNN